MPKKVDDAPLSDGQKRAIASYWKNHDRLNKSSDAYITHSSLRKYYRTRYFGFMHASRDTRAHISRNEEKVYGKLSAICSSDFCAVPVLKLRNGDAYVYSKTDARHWHENLDEIVLHVQVSKSSDTTRAYELPAGTESVTAPAGQCKKA